MPISNDSMKLSNLKIHLEAKHKEKKNEPVEYFRQLRDDLKGRRAVFRVLNSKASKAKDGLPASYEISKIVAKAGKSHFIGETVILQSLSVVASSVMKQNVNAVINSIPLSNSRVSRRIDETAEDVEKVLIAKLQVMQFTLQLDESTLRDRKAILLAYVRYRDDEGPREEILFARSLRTDTRGETILNYVAAYVEESNIPLTNISAFATDGAPSMTGRHKCFIAYLKKAISGAFCIHCVIHRQHLVARIERTPA